MSALGTGAERVVGPLLVLIAMSAALLISPSGASAAAGRGSADDPVDLLSRAMHAPSHRPYSGTQIVAAWSGGSPIRAVVRVQNDPETGMTVRLLDGPAGTEGGFTTAPPGAAAVARGMRLLSRRYAVRFGGDASIAGRPATIVDVVRTVGTQDSTGARRGGTAARFWVDDETGIVLRRELYDGQGRTVRMSAFRDISVDAPEVAANPPARRADPWTDQMPAEEMERWRDHGWTCPERLPSSLALVDARRLDADAGPITHLTYSDGLSTVSLFEQRGTLDEDSLVGYERLERDGGHLWESPGYPRQLIWSTGGSVYTLIADAPDDTVVEVLAALPAGPAEGSMDRVKRGLSRVGSWMNPFS